MPRIVVGLLLVGACLGCAEGAAVRPSAMGAEAPAREDATAVARPVTGRCETSFDFLGAPPPGGCPAFLAVPSAFVSITGECQIAHLGRSTVEANQQLIFALDESGQPLLLHGQPIVQELRNCGTFTAANGDVLHHTTIGPSRPGGSPDAVEFEAALAFTGGTGRFAASSGTATLSGGARLTTSTGNFSFHGSLVF